MSPKTSWNLSFCHKHIKTNLSAKETALKKKSDKISRQLFVYRMLLRLKSVFVSCTNSMLIYLLFHGKKKWMEKKEEKDATRAIK